MTFQVASAKLYRMSNLPQEEKIVEKRRFNPTTDKQKELIISKKNRENTHKATQLWMSCFSDYLIECGLPDPDLIATSHLPSILEDFYSVVCKKPKVTDSPVTSVDEYEDCDNPDKAIIPRRKKKKNYKNTSMKAICAAIARYYREKQSLDIISNEHFLRANAVFTGILQVNKENGLGNIESKTELIDFDLGILSRYFKQLMAGPPNLKLLQGIVILNILYYMCRQGRENLRPMKKDNFAVAVDPHDWRKYIYQKVDEVDKNHSCLDTTKSNDPCIYENPSKDKLLHPHNIRIFYTEYIA